MADKQKILIVDDDTNISNLISLYLKKECFDTLCADDGESALGQFESYKPDLILLDLMLPGIDGYEVCREIRKKSQLPIIMLSAKGEVFDKVLGLELGADDYMEKPFDSKELVARVKAVLRRFKGPNQQETPVSQGRTGSSSLTDAAGNNGMGSIDTMKYESVSYPDLTINLSDYSVTYMGRKLEMPPKELELFYFLASHPNRVFTREQLLDHIWGYEYIGDTRTVDVHVKRLREKISDHGDWALSTVWGIGYKFETKL
jgi:DNA-binding response OmpR family regulator